MAFWLTTKLTEKCPCNSGKTYRDCCLRREMAFFAIFCLAALALFAGVAGQNAVTFTVVLVVVLVVAGFAGWLVKRWLK